MKRFLAMVCILSVVASVFSSGMALAAESNDESLVSWQEYKAETEKVYKKYKITGVSYCPVDGFYCTRDMLERDLKLIEDSYIAGKSPVSFEDYKSAIIGEYEKFGQEVGVYLPEGDFYCTPTMLENDKRYASKRAQVFLKTEKAVDYSEKADTPNGSSFDNGGVEFRAMYINVPGKTITRIVLPPEGVFFYECRIQTEVTFKVDAQNGYIVSGGVPTLNVLSGTGIEDWAQLKSYSHKMDQNKHRVTTTIKCWLKKSVALGATTVWEKFLHTYEARFNGIQ